MKKETIWKIILIVSVAFILYGMANADTDKKTAKTGATLGVAGALISLFTIGPKAMGPIGWIVGGLATLAFIPGIFTSWKDMIFPPASTAIPSWIYIVGFAILALLILRKR